MSRLFACLMLGLTVSDPAIASDSLRIVSASYRFTLDLHGSYTLDDHGKYSAGRFTYSQEFENALLFDPSLGPLIGPNSVVQAGYAMTLYFDTSARLERIQILISNCSECQGMVSLKPDSSILLVKGEMSLAGWSVDPLYYSGWYRYQPNSGALRVNSYDSATTHDGSPVEVAFAVIDLKASVEGSDTHNSLSVTYTHALGMRFNFKPSDRSQSLRISDVNGITRTAFDIPPLSNALHVSELQLGNGLYFATLGNETIKILLRAK